MKAGNNVKKFIALFGLAILLITGVSSCGIKGSPDDIKVSPGFLLLPEVKVSNAYCDYSPSSDGTSFYFRFTLENHKGKDAEVTYKWTLNDPMSDEPVLHGNGNVLLLDKEVKTITLDLSQNFDFDPRFYIIYIGVYKDNSQTGYYRGQKSTYDWDYGNIPPQKRIVKPPYKHVWIDTFVEKYETGYRVNISGIIFLPPERTASLALDNIRIKEGPLLVDMQADSSSPDSKGFHDRDENGVLSTDDYLVMDSGARGEQIAFESRDEPSIRINKIGYKPESVEEENNDSIKIKNLAYKVIDGQNLEISVEVESEKPLAHVDAEFYHPAERGMSSCGDHLEPPVQSGDTLLYRKNVQHLPPDTGDLYLFIYITDGVNEVLHLIGKIN